jgi:diguanylate cyclase (GGDEF)-like protein
MPELLPLTSAFNLAITGDDEGEQLLEVCNDLVRRDLDPGVVIRITTVLAEIFTDAADSDRVTTKSLLATLGHVCGMMTATMVSDVSERARRDTLTGLENRAAWEQDIAGIPAESNWAVAMIDLDGLKKVNDEQGHKVGDKYLQRFASDLASVAPLGAVPYRLSGDEYIIRWPGGSEEQLRSTLNVLSAQEDTAAFSFGVAQGPRDASDPAGLLDIADGQMYEMKKTHKEEGA